MHPRFRSSVSATVLCALLVAASARGLSNRVFMSITGNNSNDCANPATPCLTFAGAMAQVSAGGEVIAEATGGYGPLTITQAVTISGPPGVVIYSGATVTVNAPGATVVLRGLTIDGTGATGNGINVVSVKTLHVESCVVANFAGSGNLGNGIFFASPGTLSVKDTFVRGNGHVGIWVGPLVPGSSTASVEHCRIEGNTHGLVSLASGHTTARDTVASNNSDTGFDAESGGELNLESCVSSHNGPINGNGVLSLGGGSLVRLSNTTVTDNPFGLFVNGGDILSRGNNTVEGNGVDGNFTGPFNPK